jgi:hypothetical protein
MSRKMYGIIFKFMRVLRAEAGKRASSVGWPNGNDNSKLIIDKVLLLMARSIRRLFSRVKGYSPLRIRGGDPFGRGMRIGGGPF